MDKGKGGEVVEKAKKDVAIDTESTSTQVESNTESTSTSNIHSTSIIHRW